MASRTSPVDATPAPAAWGLPAWLLSAVLHGLLFITAVFCLRFAPRGVAPEADRPASIVLVNTSAGEVEYFSEEEANDSESAAAAAAAQAFTAASAGSPLPAVEEAPLEMAGLLPSAGELQGGFGDLADALPDASDLTSDGKDGRRPLVGAGAQTRTQVFGLQGEGSKFVYVFDRSGSMEGYGGRPIAAAKAELAASLGPLESTHQFQIIFYNERPTVLNPLGAAQPRLMYGNERDKTLAIDFIRRISAAGGTEHVRPLQLALGMAPDVIFFLTDAEEPRLSDDELAQVRRWNRGESVINTIEFGAGPFDGENNFLVKLAKQNSGQHIYIDVSKLPAVR
ncbi:vWA domain-containing protein [Lignipirellula cremea]|uniref:VWFA domain-containing protein n=1 Tax=Lignipirellula cremea TaxID=2528010 RepID=A0A518E2Z4_9BACT|nr:hypothetical protein [Lignipirellula cremea]QDU98470.1 hypothetical protein Pla8534_63380 [Lignipirellula cremea]